MVKILLSVVLFAVTANGFAQDGKTSKAPVNATEKVQVETNGTAVVLTEVERAQMEARYAKMKLVREERMKKAGMSAEQIKASEERRYELEIRMAKLRAERKLQMKNKAPEAAPKK